MEKHLRVRQYVKFPLRRDTLLSYGEEINELHMIHQYKRRNANNLPG